MLTDLQFPSTMKVSLRSYSASPNELELLRKRDRRARRALLAALAESRSPDGP
jgi:hypothetical protein